MRLKLRKICGVQSLSDCTFPRNNNKGGGMTFVEFLVAFVVAGVFLSGAFAAFIQILKATDKAEASTEAINNARAALELMAIDIKAASIDFTQEKQEFYGVDNPLPYGDGIDNDRDNFMDEEYVDGIDNDEDWTLTDDNHALIGGLMERRFFVALPDLGDGHVDEDFKFDKDSLTFRILPDPLQPAGRNELIRYEIGSYEGEDNVLLRRVRYFLPGGGFREVVSPLAFNLLSLNFLYWDPNRALPYWTPIWPPADPLPPPGIELPVAIYISLTLYAGTDPLDHHHPGEPIDTITLNTIVNIEQVLNDERYR